MPTTLYLMFAGSVMLPVALLMLGAPAPVALLGTVVFLGVGYALSRG